MTRPPSDHDRALLTAAATIAAPLTLSGALLLLYLTGDIRADDLLLTGMLISAMAGATAAVIQAVRKMRAEVATARREAAAMRDELRTLRLEGAVADIAALARDNVSSINKVNGIR